MILKKLTFLKKFFPEHYRECHTVWISAVFSCWVIFLSVDFKKINILKKIFPEHYRERHTVWVHSLQRISAEDAKLQTVHRESVPKLVVGM